MRKFIRKFGSGSLALAMLAVCACGGETATTGGETTAETTPQVTTEAPPPIPDVDFGGEDLNIFLWTEHVKYMVIETETGDVIDDAVYRRNRKVQDEYNVNFKFTYAPGASGDYGTWLTTVTSSILAGDNSIQLIGGYGYRLAKDTLGTSFHNLKDIDNIDFSQPWWLGNLAEACDVGGKLFLTMGNIDPGFYSVNYAIYFNKRLAEEYNTPDLYALVDSGDWTLDKMIEITKNGAKDINGDSKFDVNDQFGFITGRNMEIDAFIQACDIKITELGKDGLPVLLGLTEKYVNVQQKVQAFMKEPEVFYSNDATKDLFMNGQALLFPATVGTAHTLREMNDDFGIIPYPKWDKAQENYITYCAPGNATGYAIPVTADAEKVGAVLESLAYYGYKDILPEYYERALKTKSARDDASAKMLDIIFDNVEHEFTAFYSFCFGDQKAPSMLMRQTIKNDVDIASAWAADEELYENTMTTIIDSLK